MGNINYQSVSVHAKVSGGSWIDLGDIADGTAVRVQYQDHISQESLDETGKDVVDGKYIGSTGSIDGVLKTFDATAFAKLFHSVTTSGGLHTFGKNKPRGASVTAFAVALKPINSSDHFGVYIPKAFNVAAMQDPHSNTPGQYSKLDFSFIMKRDTTSASSALWYRADTASAVLALPDFPT